MLVYFMNDESAQGLVEYSLIISLAVLAVIGVVVISGESVFNLYESIKNDFIAAL